MFVDSDGGSGGSGDDESGDRFVRHAYLYALGLGAAMYGSLATLIGHDMYVLQTCETACEYWTSETLALQGPQSLVLSCILFVPGLALFLLGKWFEHPS